MKKVEIDELLRTEFEGHGWRFESVAKLPSAFLRPTDVTPFFQGRVLRQSDASYVIDGYIGFISRQFESVWQRHYNAKSRVNSHCLAFHIANIDELRALQSVFDLDPDRTKLFRVAVSDILSTFPRDSDAACAVFETGRLGNLALEKFVIYGREEKLSLLKAHVCPRQLH